jgi:hypothetical protein
LHGLLIVCFFSGRFFVWLLTRHALRPWCGRPEGGGATGGRPAGVVDGTHRYELFECGVDAAAAEMALEESTDLLSGQGAGGCVDGFQDPVGGVVTGGFAKEERGAGGAVVPHREGCLKVRQPDNGAAVENSVYGTEAQNLSFGATGGGAVEARTAWLKAG